MRIALTTAGIAALQSSPSSLVLGSYRLGSGKAYVPSETDTDIHGSVVTSGVPQSPQVVNANVVRYSVFLDLNAGPFTFGEIGLYLQNGDLFSLSCGDSDILKAPGTSTMVIDVYVSSVDGSFVAWIDVGNSSDLRLASIPSVDLLPPSKDANPNVYAVTGATSTQSTFLAYTDRRGLWMFDAYKFATTYGSHIPIVGYDSQSITLDISHYDENWELPYFGALVIQFGSGDLYSICRYVEQVVVGTDTFTVVFSTPLLQTPDVGDLVMRFKREPLSLSSLVLNPATRTELGGVIVGDGLEVEPSGLLSVDPDTVPGGLVKSVNGYQGDVELEASDIPGTVQTVNGQAPDASGNVNVSSFTLPVASDTTLGGVRVPGPDLSVDPATGDLRLGFTPVTSVNAQSGDVVIEGLVDPIELTTGQDLDLAVDSGLFYASTDGLAQSLLNAPPDISAGVLEVVTLGADQVIQRWSQNNGLMFSRLILNGVAGTWSEIGGASSIPIATDSRLGIVMVGDGLDVDGTGIISAKLRTVNGTEPDDFGNVDIDVSNLDVVPLTSVGIPGGVAGPLSDFHDDHDHDEDDPDPDPEPEPDPDEYDYIYGRIPQEQLPLGALVYIADWDASLNLAEDHGEVMELRDAGSMMLSTELFPDPFLVPANGKIFRVSVAGSTSLDGIDNWAVGDLALAIGDRWYKIGSPNPDQMTEVVVDSGDTVSLTVPSWLTDPIGGDVIVRVKDVGNDNWYDAAGVASLTYSAGGITLTNEYSATLTFRYRFVRN